MPHPDFLLRILTARQLNQLRIYDNLQPIGAEREDLRAAMICLEIWKSKYELRSGEDGPKPVDWMPFSNYGDSDGAKPAEQSAEEQVAIFQALTGGGPEIGPDWVKRFAELRNSEHG